MKKNKNLSFCKKLTNADSSKIFMLINYISVILFTSLALYLTILHNKNYLFKLQDLSLFLPTRMFFLNTVNKPGGFLSYCGLFLTQFFYYPWLGSLFLIILLFVIQFLTRKAFNLFEEKYPLSFLPSLLLLLTISQLGYYIYILYSNGYIFSNLLGVIICLGAFWIYRNIEGSSLRLLYSFLFVIVFFHIAGLYSLLTLFLFVIFEVVTIKKSTILLNLINILFPLILMFGIPFLFYRFFYVSTAYPNVYFAGLPKLAITGDFILWLPYFALCAFLISFVFNFLPQTKAHQTRQLFFCIPALVFFLVMIGVFHFSYKDENFRTELAMEQAIFDSDWEKVLTLSRQLKGEPTRLIVRDTYLALRKMHNAGDKMFTLKNGNKPFNTRKPVLQMEIAGKMFYFHYGMINNCYRWCMEDMINNGMKIENLKYFVKTSLLNKEMPLAKKYNDVLKKTLFHKIWAKKYQLFIENPEEIKSDSEFKEILPLIDPINKLLTEKKEMLEEYLLYSIASINVGSPELVELAMQCNLEIKNSKGFWPFFHYYIKTHSRIPVHYQEAALLFSYLEKNVDISIYKFDSEILNNFREFAVMIKQYSNLSRGECEPIFNKNFGNTYWYYYFFSKKFEKEG